MKWPTLASICCLLALPALAFAQTPTVERQVKGKPDTNINAGIFATIRNNCTAGPLPAVRLVTPPAHGQVTVKQGKLRATNLKQCLGMELPAFIAIYRSAQDFIGQLHGDRIGLIAFAGTSLDLDHQLEAPQPDPQYAEGQAGSKREYPCVGPSGSPIQTLWIMLKNSTCRWSSYQNTQTDESVSYTNP